MMYRKQVRSAMAELKTEQRTYRDKALAKVRELAGELQLSKVIVATSFTYFDILLEKNVFGLNEEDYHNYMLGCLLISTKFHEGCQENPKSSRLAKYLKNILQESGMRALELKISSQLGWNFDMQTPTQFVSYFVTRGSPT